VYWEWRSGDAAAGDMFVAVVSKVLGGRGMSPSYEKGGREDKQAPSSYIIPPYLKTPNLCKEKSPRWIS
jgi:hypothetical protein